VKLSRSQIKSHITFVKASFLTLAYSCFSLMHTNDFISKIVQYFYNCIIETETKRERDKLTVMFKYERMRILLNLNLKVHLGELAANHQKNDCLLNNYAEAMILRTNLL